MFNNSTFNFFRSNQTQTSIFKEELYHQLNQQLSSPNISYDLLKWAPSNDISYQSFLNEQEIDNVLNIQLPLCQQSYIHSSNENDKMSRQYSQQSQYLSDQKQNITSSEMICEQENIIQCQTNIDGLTHETHFFQKHDYYYQLIQKYNEPPQTQILEEESQELNNEQNLSKQLKQQSITNIDNFETTQSTKSQINQSSSSKSSEIQKQNNINLQTTYGTNQNWMKLKLRKEAKQYEIYKTKDFNDLLQSLPGLYIHQDEGEIRVDKIRLLENEEDQYYQKFELTINPQRIIGPIKIKKHIKIHVRFKKNYSGIVYHDKQLMNKIPTNQVDGVTIKNEPLVFTNVSEHQVKLICCIVNIKCKK